MKTNPNIAGPIAMLDGSPEDITYMVTVADRKFIFSHNKNDGQGWDGRSMASGKIRAPLSGWKEQ